MRSERFSVRFSAKRSGQSDGWKRGATVLAVGRGQWVRERAGGVDAKRGGGV